MCHQDCRLYSQPARASTSVSRSRTQQRRPHPVGDLAGHFGLRLQAANKAPHTVSSYLEALAIFSGFLLLRRIPVEIKAFTRKHVEAFIAESPMANLKAPHVPEGHQRCGATGMLSRCVGCGVTCGVMDEFPTCLRALAPWARSRPIARTTTQSM